METTVLTSIGQVLIEREQAIGDLISHKPIRLLSLSVNHQG